jgi:hypothetical protein
VTRVAIRYVNEWGSTAEERASAWPCDALLPDADLVLYRSVDVAAPAVVAFRWLCQLRVAPYSYDWLDNRGRRSPRHLTPDLDALKVGQRVMRVFELVGFTPGEDLTLRARGNLFGDLFVTYRVTANGARASRYAVKLVARQRRDALGVLWRYALPAGDLVMMRKQLLTLARLAGTEAKKHL